MTTTTLENAAGGDAAGRRGLLLGLCGVLGFSLTLPATRIAVATLHPAVVGLGRALVAACFAALCLLATRQRRPTWAECRGLLVVALGVILAFPLLSAWALRQVPAAHGAVMTGLLPLATAVAAALRVGERPSPRFWATSVAGSLLVLGFALYEGAGSLSWADGALLLAVAGAAMGYAEGARVARTLGSWQVICWALVLASPLLLAPVGLAVAAYGASAPLAGWLCFAYVALISQFLAFFAWYRGLALGGVARVGQIQLLQPFLTLAASGLLLGEHVSLATIGFALLVLGVVAAGRKAAVRR